MQGSNPGLLHCRQILYHLSHQGSLFLLICKSCFLKNSWMVACPFSILMVSLVEQKFLLLIKYNLLIFILMVNTLCALFRKVFFLSQSRKKYTILSTKSLVLSFTFRYRIHLKLNFMYNVRRYGLSFFSFYVDILCPISFVGEKCVKYPGPKYAWVCFKISLYHAIETSVCPPTNRHYFN